VEKVRRGQQAEAAQEESQRFDSRGWGGGGRGCFVLHPRRFLHGGVFLGE